MSAFIDSGSAGKARKRQALAEEKARLARTRVQRKPVTPERRAELEKAKARQTRELRELVTDAKDKVDQYASVGDTRMENQWRANLRILKAKLRKLEGAVSVTAPRGSGNVLNNGRIGELRGRVERLKQTPRKQRTRAHRNELKACEAELRERTLRDRRVNVSTDNSSQDDRRVGTVAGRASKAGPATRVTTVSADGDVSTRDYLGAAGESPSGFLSNGRTDADAGVADNGRTVKHIWWITDSQGTRMHAVDRREYAPKIKAVGDSDAHVKGAPHTHNGTCHLGGSFNCIADHMDDYR